MHVCESVGSATSVLQVSCCSVYFICGVNCGVGWWNHDEDYNGYYCEEDWAFVKLRQQLFVHRTRCRQIVLLSVTHDRCVLVLLILTRKMIVNFRGYNFNCAIGTSQSNTGYLDNVTLSFLTQALISCWFYG